MSIFLLSLLISVSSGEVPQAWLLGSTELRFVESPEKGLINPSCLSARTCLAGLALKHKQPSPVGSGGKNPGSAVCQDFHKGAVIVARRAERTQAFCRFPDGSYASLDGLVK